MIDIEVAWIGVIGAAIGAGAGIVGGWLTFFLTSRQTRVKEIRDAAADLIAKASVPSVLSDALDAGGIGRHSLGDIVIPWSEETMRSRAKLAGLAPEVFSLCDFLWQRSSDQMNALLRNDRGEVASLRAEVVMITVELEQALAKETSRRHIQRALD
jgi:hypothetical protein